MSGFTAIIDNIFILAIAMLVGFIAVKTGYIPRSARDGLSKVLVKVTLPILVVTTMTKIELDRERIINCASVLILAWICIAIMYLFGVAAAKLFRMHGERAVLHSCMSCFGNIVFIAYPLIRVIYGDEGILYAALFSFANDCYLWTVGVYKLSSVHSGGGSLTKNLGKLVNQGTIAVAFAFVMMALHIKFGGILKTALEGIGGTTSYLSMIFLGGTLADVDFRNIYKRVPLYVLTLVKMIAFPIALAFVFSMTELDRTVAGVVIMQCAMPASTVLAILAAEYKCDVLYGAEGSFVTTLASIGTIPLVYMAITQFFR